MVVWLCCGGLEVGCGGYLVVGVGCEVLWCVVVFGCAGVTVVWEFVIVCLCGFGINRVGLNYCVMLPQLCQGCRV